jgi:hypothetical protein
VKIIQKMPPAIQERVLKEGVDVVEVHGDQMRTFRKKVEEVKQQQVNQVFSRNGPVPKEEQEKVLQTQALSDKKIYRRKPWYVKDGELYVRAQARIEHEDICEIYRLSTQFQEAKKKSLEADIKKNTIVRPRS